MARVANGVRAGGAPCARSAAVGAMTGAERLDEVAGILALGIRRLQIRRNGKESSDPNRLSGFGLDFPPERSVCRMQTDQSGERS